MLENAGDKLSAVPAFTRTVKLGKKQEAAS
jgi:hypothetical protein